MTASRQFQPNWLSAPGETILDIIHERDWTTRELAGILGQSQEQITFLLEGRASITLGLAQKLADVLGGNAGFWIARDGQYRDDAARISAEGKRWLSEFPVKEMIRFGWIQPPKPTEEVRACLQFFGMGSIPAWRAAYSDLLNQVRFRTTQRFDSKPGSVVAWLRAGELKAGAIRCQPWNKDGFVAALGKARELTCEKDPGKFLPELTELCAASGVGLAIVRSLQGCRASGATRFLSPERAMLLLSFRYLADDQFWFSFFHEAGHLILHGPDSTFLEGLDLQASREETEANKFAERALIRDEFRAEFEALRPDIKQIIRFARKAGIAPGIVVGQLQHYKVVGPHQLNLLKRRYEWAKD